jgi:TRAP-type C4-dicarboxylate transport system permease small subunit
MEQGIRRAEGPADASARPAHAAGWGHALGVVFDGLNTALTYLAVGLLLLMTVSVGYEVFMRYFRNQPTAWVVDFSEYALLYLALLPAAWVLGEEGHVRIDLVERVLPGRARLLLNTVTSVVGVAVCAIFCWSSAALTWDTFRSGEILFRAIHVPKWLIIAAIPIGMLLLTIQFGRRAWLYGRRFRKG